MQVDIKKLNAVKSEITLTVPADQADKDYRKYFNKSAAAVQVPGFRKGKAPMAMVERSHGARIREYFVEMMTETSFHEAVKEHNIEFLCMPEVTKIDWNPGTDLTINLMIENEPEFVFNQLEGLIVPYKPFTLEKDVERYLAELQQKSAIMVEAEDEIREEDEVQLEFRLAAKPGGNFWTAEIRMEENDKDIQEALIGKKIGDTVQMELSAERLYQLTREEGMAGSAPADYTLMVNSIRRKQMPQIDDEFAKDHEFDDLAQMQAQIGEELAALNEQKNVYIKHQSILAMLLKDNPFELPRKAINYLVEQEMRKYTQIKDPQYREYFEYQIRYEIMQDMIKTYLLKNLIAQYPCEVTDHDREEYIKHIAILLDTTVGAWKDKNQEGLEKNVFADAIHEFTVMSKIAATCEFVETEDEPEVLEDDEFEVMPDESQVPSSGKEDINSDRYKEEA